jgi:glycine cleavage system H protein
MMYPADAKYTKDHEWIKVSGAEATVGITDYAQKQLGDVVYVDLPEVGKSFAAGEVFGTIESVKAVSELFAPVGGEVVAANTELGQRPEQVNTDPHGSWMIKIRVANPAELDALLDSAQYADLVK